MTDGNGGTQVGLKAGNKLFLLLESACWISTGRLGLTYGQNGWHLKETATGSRGITSCESRQLFSPKEDSAPPGDT